MQDSQSPYRGRGASPSQQSYCVKATVWDFAKPDVKRYMAFSCLRLADFGQLP
jgi:hypothetical protein